MNSVTSLLNEAFDGAPEQSKIVTREMSITATQFLARLSQVKEGILDAKDSDRACCSLRNSSGTVDITWRKRAKRYIGALALPVIEVRLDFSAYRAEDIERFVQSFDLAFLKMGC